MIASDVETLDSGTGWQGRSNKISSLAPLHEGSYQHSGYDAVFGVTKKVG